MYLCGLILYTINFQIKAFHTHELFNKKNWTFQQTIFIFHYRNLPYQKIKRYGK